MSYHCPISVSVLTGIRVWSGAVNRGDTDRTPQSYLSIYALVRLLQRRFPLITDMLSDHGSWFDYVHSSILRPVYVP